MPIIFYKTKKSFMTDEKIGMQKLLDKIVSLWYIYRRIRMGKVLKITYCNTRASEFG